MLIRHAATIALAALVLGACGTGEAYEAAPVPPAAAVTTEVDLPVVPAAHLETIGAYWDEREAAFRDGVRPGVEFIVARLPAGLDYSTDDCMRSWFDGADLDGFLERSTLDPASVAPATEWVMTIGAREVEPTADAYRMEVDLSYEGTPGWWPDRRVAAYLEVDASGARNFVRCETVAAAAVRPSGAAAGKEPVETPVETLVRTTSVRTLMAEGGVSAASTPGCPNPRIEIRGDTAFIFCPSPAPGEPRPGDPPPAGTPEPAEPTGSRPPGTGMDFCRGDGDDREQAGDYFVCGTDQREPRG